MRNARQAPRIGRAIQRRPRAATCPSPARPTACPGGGRRTGPGGTPLGIRGDGNTDGEPKLAVRVKRDRADYCFGTASGFGAASALAIMSATDAVVIG